jgi:hypothetical protein
LILALNAQALISNGKWSWIPSLLLCSQIIGRVSRDSATCEPCTEFWPTPTVGNSKNARNSTARRFVIPPTGIHAGNTLTDAVTMWPTPQAYAKGKPENSVPGLTPLDIHVRGLYAKPVSPQLTLFAEAFPVSRTRSLADVPEPQTSAISGRNSLDSFASLDPDGSWRKTCQGYSQVTLDGSLERFSETWPRAGMTRNGTAYLHPPLAPLTSGTGFGWWLTPTVADAANRAFSINSRGEPKLSAQVKVCPTPPARDYKSPGTPERLRLARQQSRRGQPLTEHVGGQLNPTWVEWLMGYPLGWTACAAWATRSSRRSRNGSHAASSKQKK